MPRLQFDPARSTLAFEGRSSLHPIRAAADAVVGWIELNDDGRPVTGHLTVEVERLRTGNPLYDREIRSRLEANRFPTFEAHLREVHDEHGSEARVTGAVSAHGVQVDLAGTITVEPAGGGVRVSGSEAIDFRQFDLKAPRLLTLKVEPVVTVVLDATTVAPG